MRLPTEENALKMLEKYRGQRGKYKQDLGDEGVAALWVLCNGSPLSAAEFLGYSRKSLHHISKTFAASGLEVCRREQHDYVWSRYPQQEKTVDDIRKQYLDATAGPEMAYEYNWYLPNDLKHATLITVSDIHYGHKAVDYGRWLKLRDWIHDNPHVRWIFLGDMFDQAVTTSPGKSMMEQELSYDEAVTLALDDITVIAGQCVGLHCGNHDERIAKALKIDHNPVRDIARQLDIPYLGYESYVRYVIKTYNPKAKSRRYTTQQEYIGYHHHGVGSGQTWGSFFNAMERLEKSNAADFIVMGHRHQKAAVQKTRRRVARDNRIEVTDVPLVGAGCFLKHESRSYAAEKGYAPSVLGAATIHMYVDKHSVHARA